MARMVTVREAKAHFSRLLARVQAGEEIVIAKAGHPMARLVPIPPKTKRRTPGTAKGKVHISEDFDAPLPDSILNDFET